MSTKPNILIFIDWFLPGFKAGGPIKSVANIINALHQDFNFFIITSDRDLNDSISYKNTPLNQWIRKEKYSIIYLSPETRNEWIKDHLSTHKNYTHYYFNSVFSKNFTLIPLKILKKLNLSHKIILAPRGMLGKGALSIKPLKKKIFLFFANILGYYKNIIWHATNMEERRDVMRVFGESTRIKIASNISFNNVTYNNIVKDKGKLKLVFFSRISPKKNLLYALEVIKNKPELEFAIYGSIEDEAYWDRCQTYINENHINAHYKGELLPENVQSTLSNYHFFLLPTLHENFGHVIVEALTSGCGLILSNNTPWLQLEDKRIGWDIDLSQSESFSQVIKHCIDMVQEDYNTYRNNCYTFVNEELNSKKEIIATKEMFNQ